MPNRVIPAQAGIQALVFQEFKNCSNSKSLDSRLRGNGGVGRSSLNLR